MGAKVLLVGRLLPESMPLERPYAVHRMNLWFRKGAFFYAEYNIRLFFLLTFRRADVLLANDLDTLLSNYLASKLKGAELVYDSHEYFTEVPELINRKRVQRAWQRIEQFIFPKLTRAYTVNDSIASIYREKYGVNVRVVRNLPEVNEVSKFMSREELGLPDNRFVMVLQGAGINIQRGAEEMIEAMSLLPDCFLAIVGSGDVIEMLKEQVHHLKISDRVMFRSRMPYPEMMQYALNADLGLSLDKDTNLNYRFSLPNKLFDYLKAGIPVLVSDLPEIRKVVDQYKVGYVLSSHRAEDIALTVKNIMNDKQGYAEKSFNTKRAAAELNWQSQEGVLNEIFSEIVR